MANECELLINDVRYGGWKDIDIQRGIEQISGAFRLEVTERWPEQAEPRPIKPGDQCQVLIDGVTVITGYVDECSPGREAAGDRGNTWFAVSGRDKTGDLVDCSAIYQTGQWKGQSLARIARDICAPFGIEVVVDALAAEKTNKVIPSHKIEEGETAFDCIERASRWVGVLLIADGLGNLVITLPGSVPAQTALISGENIKREEGRFSWAERFSQYIVKGQTREKANVKATAADAVVSRYRPLIVMAEDQPHGPSGQARADWEMTTRAGRANRATVTVQSWRQGGDSGELWTPGLRVLVQSDYLRVDAQMMIVSVSYVLSESEGCVARLEICDPRGYDKLAGLNVPELEANKGKRKGRRSKGKKDKNAKGPQDWGKQ